MTIRTDREKNITIRRTEFNGAEHIGASPGKKTWMRSDRAVDVPSRKNVWSKCRYGPNITERGVPDPIRPDMKRTRMTFVMCDIGRIDKGFGRKYDTPAQPKSDDKGGVAFLAKTVGRSDMICGPCPIRPLLKKRIGTRCELKMYDNVHAHLDTVGSVVGSSRTLGVPCVPRMSNTPVETMEAAHAAAMQCPDCRPSSCGNGVRTCAACDKRMAAALRPMFSAHEWKSTSWEPCTRATGQDGGAPREGKDPR